MGKEYHLQCFSSNLCYLQISGFDHTVDEISRMVLKAKKEAGISHDTPLQSLVSSSALSVVSGAIVYFYAGNGSEWRRAGGGTKEDKGRHKRVPPTHQFTLPCLYRHIRLYCYSIS